MEYEYEYLTQEEKLAMLRGRITTEERQHYETSISMKVVGNESDWARTNMPSLQDIERRINVLKDELATLEAATPSS